MSAFTAPPSLNDEIGMSRWMADSMIYLPIGSKVGLDGMDDRVDHFIRSSGAPLGVTALRYWRVGGFTAAPSPID